MIIHNRPYDELQRDFERVWRFLLRDYADRQDRFVWLFSRFGDWKYGLHNSRKYVPSFLRKNAQLWLNAFDELLGFVISEEGDNTFMLFVRHGHEHLAGEMLDWVVNHWSARGMLRTEVHEYQPAYMELLAARGFRNAGPLAVTRQYDLTGPLKRDVALPEGYTIASMLENHDYAGKLLVSRNAFRNVNTVTDLDLLTFEYARECPAYDPAFDLSVIVPDGAHVSSCVGFVDYENRVSEIERVCTHSAYRRKGLAEAVIRACMARLSDAGIACAYITSYGPEADGLYAKLGAVKQRQWFAYELPSEH
jgi:ribosomal protein S18 acetylase RimI-like enzyme